MKHSHTHTQGTVVVCGGQSINTGSSWHWLNLSCNSSIATFLSTATLIQLRINILSSVSTMNKSDLLPAIWTKLLSHLYRDQKVRYSILAKYRERSNVFSTSANQMQTGSEFKPHYFSWSWGWTSRSSTLPQTFHQSWSSSTHPPVPFLQKGGTPLQSKGTLYHIHYTTAYAGSFFPFLTCLSESLQDWQKVLFHCLSKLLPQPYFCLWALSSSLASLVTLKYYKHHWKKPGKNVKLFTNLLSFPYRIEERSFSFSASLVHCSYAFRRLKMTEKTKI